jgi:hypothetical protein
MLPEGIVRAGDITLCLHSGPMYLNFRDATLQWK